jgi:hypothetical protein
VPRAARQMTLEHVLPVRDDDIPWALRGMPLVRVTDKYWCDLSPEIREALVVYERSRSIGQGLRWLEHTVEVERLLGIEVQA